MHGDTVTPSPRAPFKDSSPCQKPPPPHTLPTVWGGRLCLISISKALNCQLSQAASPPLSLRTWAPFDCGDVRSMRVTSEDDITRPGEPAVDMEEHRNAPHLAASICVSDLLLQRFSTLSVYHKGASQV